MARTYVLRPFRSEAALRIDYRSELNDQQYAAVSSPPGPALVIAGAGSGKTRTLTYRVAYLIEQGIPPERLLLLTFTNKAAREMMRRVNDLLGEDLSSLWGGTFHAVGHRILRRYAERVGHRPGFTIMDREDAKDLLHSCLGEAEIDVKAKRFPRADVLGDIFSLASNMQQTIPEVLASHYDYFLDLASQIESVWQIYEKRKRSAGTVDFDDLLRLWLELLRAHEDVREQYQRRFQFVLVDEYQDTNRLQGELIDLLVAQHHQVMVVGDDAQSIYSWRGADFRNILHFPERYPEATVYRIETNYRSTPEVLELANACLAANVHQFAKRLVAARPAGTKPALVACGDAAQQATFVAQRALELRDEGVALGDMAVLYRAHFHALELQLELTRRNIPFSITSGIRFFEQAHIKDVVSYIKLVLNPADEVAFRRVLRLLPGVGTKTADKLVRRVSARLAEDQELHKAEASVEQAHTAPRLAKALARSSSEVPKKTAAAWAQFVATIAQLEAPEKRERVPEMIQLILDAGYEEYLKEEYPNYRSRLDDLGQLADFSRQFESVTNFLSELALLTNLEGEETRAMEKDSERMRLSTVHQAKGLEFRVVFVIMLCDGLFPSNLSLESSEKEEEERRLFYVAVTRAKTELYLAYPLMRRSRGTGEISFQDPSRFIREIPESLREAWDLR